jgi:hypothetical protein
LILKLLSAIPSVSLLPWQQFSGNPISYSGRDTATDNLLKNIKQLLKSSGETKNTPAAMINTEHISRRTKIVTVHKKYLLVNTSSSQLLLKNIC